MMARRDFNALAQALLAAKKEINCEAAERHRQVVIDQLCIKLASIYPRFERNRFIDVADGRRDEIPRRR